MRKIWRSREDFDFSELDTACLALLANAPDACIIVQVSTYMPPWWLKENPDDATAFYGGEKAVLNNDFQSLASEKWLKDMDYALRRLIRHMENQKYSSRIIGVVPSDGSTFEWMWSVGRGHQSRTFSGYSPVALASFRKFLREKYQSDETLSAVWKRPGAKIAEVMPPPPERLDSASLIDMLDPRKDKDLMDWFEYRNKIISDDFITLCGIVKDASAGRLLAGSYYGYLVMFSHMRFLLQEGGHLGIHKVAESPHVDFVIGPTIYHWRRLGMSDSTMQPDGAFTCHGKPVICELDYRTFSDPTDYERRNGKVDTVEQTASMMNFGFGMLLTRGLAGHYMELHDRWFLEPVLQEVIRKQEMLYESLPEKSAGLTPFDVCIVSDEISPMYVKNNIGDGIHVNLVSELFRRLRESGFAYRHVLLPDILTPGLLPSHKLYIMTNTLVLDSSQRKALQERFRKENASVLYLYAPGAFYPDAPPSPANVEEMTGMQCRMLMRKQPLTMKLEQAFGGKTIFHRIATGPWFPITGGYDEVIGTSPDGEVLAAGRRDGKRNLWFSTFPNLPPDLLKRLARRAGVQIYSNSEDPVRIGNDFIFLQAKTGGNKAINLPDGYRIRGVIGPLKDVLASGEKWRAEPGITYGFQVFK